MAEDDSGIAPVSICILSPAHTISSTLTQRVIDQRDRELTWTASPGAEGSAMRRS
jgi:hypothetical protein